MTFDRAAEGYVPQFDIDAEVGRQGEMFIARVIQAIATASIEVKADVVAGRTGNLYVEFSCCRRGEWRPSGIATTSAELWAYALGSSQLALVIPTNVLREAARERYRQGHIRECSRGSHPTKGVVIPFAFLLNWVVTHEGEAA